MGRVRRGVAPDTILAFLRSVADLLRPLGPRVVYLAAPDPDTAFRSRGVDGFEGLLAYWREHNAL
jgi:hypothetical protein